MFAYLLLSDQSSERMFWAAVFLFTGWFGCTVYFFKIYRKHRLVDSVTRTRGRYTTLHPRGMA
jgi:hypothetical protein